MFATIAAVLALLAASIFPDSGAVTRIAAPAPRERPCIEVTFASGETFSLLDAGEALEDEVPGDGLLVFEATAGGALAVYEGARCRP